MSLQKFGLAQQFGAEPEWVGLANYGKILTDPHMWVVFFRSVVFCAVCASLSMVMGMLIALLLTKVSSLGAHRAAGHVAAGLGHPGPGDHGHLAVVVRCALRAGELGPRAHRVPRHGRLPVDVHPDGCLHDRRDHRDLGQPPADRVHDLLRPDAGARGSARGRGTRRRGTVDAFPQRHAPAHHPCRHDRRTPADRVGPARLHADLRTPAGRRVDRGDQPPRHLHLPDRHRPGEYGDASALATIVLILTLLLTWKYIAKMFAQQKEVSE